MKRTALLVALALVLVFAAALLNVNRAASDDHAMHKRQSQSQQPQLSPAINGAANPAAIPDHAAQEAVLRILAFDEPDRLGDRKKAYLSAYGFDENAQAALMLAAREYKRLVEPIERETDDIKNHSWPNPPASARALLDGLQRNKEAVIASVASELHGRLQTYRSSDKWANHIADTVKRKMKGFASELPVKKVGFLRLLPDPFAAYAQAGGCDPTYVYTDAVGSIPYAVYGYSSYSAGANNCGHEFNVSTQMTRNGSLVTSGTDYVSFDLDAGSYFYDGFFYVYTGVAGYCPVGLVTFPAGSNSDSETVDAFVEVKRLSVSDDDVAYNAPVNLIAEVKASGSVAGNAIIGFGTTSNPSPITFNPAVSSLTCTAQLTSSVHEASCSVTATPVSTTPAKKGPVTFYAGVNTAPAGSVATGGTPTATVCFGPKSGPTCLIQ